MSAYPNLFEVLDDNGDAVAQEIDRKSKIIIKEVPITKKKEAPKKEEKKADPAEKAIDGFEVKARPPRQPKAEKASPSTEHQASFRGGRGGRGRGEGRPPRQEGDRPPRQEGDRPPRRQDGDGRPPRGDRPPRQEGEGDQRPPRGDRPPRQEGDQPRRRFPRQEGDRPPRQERNFEENGAPQDGAEETGERSTFEPRGRGRGRGGRGGRGRGFFNNRGNSEGGHDLTEGAPIEAEEGHHYHRANRGRPLREDKLVDDKGFVQAKQRAYDRRSATGRTGDDVKRSGRGAANWGSVGDENLDAYEEAAAFEKAVDQNEAAPVDAEIPQAEEAPVAPRETRDKPEEDNTRTLKEYRETLGNDLAQIPLPPPRLAGEDSKDTWKNCKVLKKNDHNLKLSVTAPPKEKKKSESTTTTPAAAKPKTRGSQVPVEQLLTFKLEPRQDRPPRRDFQQKERPAHHKQAKAPAKEAVSEAPKIDKNSSDFPALAAVKN